LLTLKPFNACPRIEILQSIYGQIPSRKPLQAAFTFIARSRLTSPPFANIPDSSVRVTRRVGIDDLYVGFKQNSTGRQVHIPAGLRTPLVWEALARPPPTGRPSFLAEPPARILLGALRHFVSCPRHGAAGTTGLRAGMLLSSIAIAYLPTTSCSFHFFYQSSFHLSLTVIVCYRFLSL